MWTMLIYHTAIILGAPFATILGIHLASSLCLIPLSPDPVSLFVVHSLILAEHKVRNLSSKVVWELHFLRPCMSENVFMQPSRDANLTQYFRKIA